MEYEVLRREMICGELPTEMCHASTLLESSDGGVCCAWFGGTYEGEDDVSIWVARRQQDGWRTPQPVVDHIREPHWNPVLQRLEDGSIRLYYKVGRKIADWRTMVCRSEDEGLTWSAPKELVEGDDTGGRGPVRSKVIRLPNGRYLAPNSTERGLWCAYADRSDDGGVSWTRSSPIQIPGLERGSADRPVESSVAVSAQSFQGRGVIQPTLWSTSSQAVHMLLRSTEGCIYKSDSADGGVTWCPPYPTALPNNNSGIDVGRLEDGRLVLACNPVSGNWGVRSPMRLLISQDNGTSWETLLDLDSGIGEFSYPAVITQGNTIQVSYTWKRTNIAYWKIRLSGCELGEENKIC